MVASKKTVKKSQQANKPMTRKAVYPKEFLRTFIEPFDDDEEFGQRVLCSLIMRKVVMAYNDKVYDSRKFRSLVIDRISYNSDNSSQDVRIDFNIFVEDIFGNIDKIPAFGLFVFYKMCNLFEAEILDGEAIEFGKTFEEYISKQEETVDEDDYS